MLRFALIIPIALHVLFSAQLRADAPKLDIPDEPSQAKADAFVKQLFKADYASNDPAARRALAKKLLQQAHDEKTDPAPRFVLFREARNLAASWPSASGSFYVASGRGFLSTPFPVSGLNSLTRI